MEVPDQKNTFCTRVLHFEPGVVRFSLCEHLKLQCLGQTLQAKASNSSQVDTDAIHMVKWTRPSPSELSFSTQLDVYSPSPVNLPVSKCYAPAA